MTRHMRKVGLVNRRAGPQVNTKTLPPCTQEWEVEEVKQGAVPPPMIEGEGQSGQTRPAECNCCVCSVL